jgi:hypothetical protein
VTAPRIVNVTATVCFEWKNSADCPHLTRHSPDARRTAMVGLMPFPGNKFERKGPVLLSPSIVCQEGKEGRQMPASWRPLHVSRRARWRHLRFRRETPESPRLLLVRQLLFSHQPRLLSVGEAGPT